MPPTVYRPPQKPATAPTAKKNNGPLFALIGAGVLAVIGLAGTGLMWSGKSAEQAKVAQLKDSASAMATALGVSLAADTNTPVDWTTAWATMDKAIAEQKQALADAQAKVTTLEQQVADLETQATAAAADIKTKADAQAAQLKSRTDELAALKTATDEQIANLQQELEGAKQALADAQAAAEAASAQVASAPEASMPAEGMASDPAAVPVEGEAAPVVAEAAAVAGAAAGAVLATEAAASSTDDTASADGAAMEEPAQDGQFAFPEKNQTLKAAAYDAAGKILKITLANGTELVYRAVPYDLYEGLINAPVAEVFYRMKLVGNFPVEPNDKEALRALRR